MSFGFATIRTLSRSLSVGALLGVLAAAGAAAEEVDLCAMAQPIAADDVVRAFTDARNPSLCFVLDLTTPGTLLLAASVPAGEPEPRLVFRGACENGGLFEYLDELASSLLVDVRTPGRYLLCARAQDPAAWLGEVKLTSGFAAPGPLHKDGDPEEDEPPPDQVSAGVDALRTICRHAVADDYADVTSCANRLTQAAAGELENGWGDDEDVFFFVLGELRTVRVEARGDASLALLDRSGQRLASGDDAGQRLVRTLVPGLYYVRLRGEGHYDLSLELVEE